MAQTYLIPVQEIKDYTFVDDNVSDKMIKIAILDAQEQILEPILGDNLYDALINYTKNQTMPAAYQTMVVTYIWPVMLQATVFKLSYNLLLRLTNSSVVKDDNQNSKGVSVQELNVLISERELSMNYHIKKLKAHLSAYATTYPEYLATPAIDGEMPDLSETGYSIWDYDD